MKYHLLFFAVMMGITSCMHTDKKLLGSWDNKQGQIFEFRQDGKALWILYSDTSRYAFEITYTTNFSATPKQLDLSNFKAGPLAGKTLLGIVEFTSDSTILFDAEPTSTRPSSFNKEQTHTYYKIRQQ